ncbi:mucin-19-like [Sycon ciliatum]|uniref:mucin-19-like n=1 Tax=Sycon ciliatum TaxID=27933 RepID=UPI0031F660C9
MASAAVSRCRQHQQQQRPVKPRCPRRSAVPRPVADAPLTFTRSFHRSGAVRTPIRTVSLLSAAMEASLMTTYCQVTSFLAPISPASPAKPSHCTESHADDILEDFRTLIAVLHPRLTHNGDNNATVALPAVSSAPESSASLATGGSRMGEFELTKRSLTVKSSPDGYGFVLRSSAPVLVSQVKQGSAACNAGLQHGDLIVKVNGHDVSGRSHGDIIHLINYMPGSPITFTVLTPSYEKGGSELEVSRAWARHYLPNFLASASSSQTGAGGNGSSGSSPRVSNSSSTTSLSQRSKTPTTNAAINSGGNQRADSPLSSSHTPPLVRPRGNSSSFAVQRHAAHGDNLSTPSKTPSSPSSSSLLMHSPVSPMSSADDQDGLDPAERKKMLLLRGPVNIFAAPSSTPTSRSSSASASSSVQVSPFPSPARQPSSLSGPTATGKPSQISMAAAASSSPPRASEETRSSPAVTRDTSARAANSSPRTAPVEEACQRDAATADLNTECKPRDKDALNAAAARSQRNAVPAVDADIVKPAAAAADAVSASVDSKAMESKSPHSESSASKAIAVDSPASLAANTASVFDRDEVAATAAVFPSPKSPRTASFALGSSPAVGLKAKDVQARTRSVSVTAGSSSSPQSRRVPDRPPPNVDVALRQISATLHARLPARTPSNPGSRASTPTTATARKSGATAALVGRSVAAETTSGKSSPSSSPGPGSSADVRRRLSVRTATMPAWQWSALQVRKWLVVNEYEDAADIDRVQGLEGLQLLSLRATEQVWNTLGVQRTKHLLVLINGLRKDLSLEPLVWDQPTDVREVATEPEQGSETAATSGVEKSTETVGASMADTNGDLSQAGAGESASDSDAKAAGSSSSPATTVKDVPVAMPRRVTPVIVAQRPKRPPPPRSSLAKDASRTSINGLSSADVSDWQAKEVDKWLHSFGELEYMLYAEVFAENAVTGHTLLRLDNHKLIAIGVSDQALRKRMLQEVEQLRLCHEEREVRRMLMNPIGRQRQQQQQQRLVSP